MTTPGRSIRALLLILTLSLLACSGFGCGDSDRGGGDAGATQDAGDAGSDAPSDDAGECAELGESCATAPCCSGLRCVGVALPGMTSMECEAE